MEKTLQVLNLLEHDGVVRRYAIGGAMGASFYVEPVLTFDLDIFVILPQTDHGLLTLEPLYEALRARGGATATNGDTHLAGAWTPGTSVGARQSKAHWPEMNRGSGGSKLVG